MIKTKVHNIQPFRAI